MLFFLLFALYVNQPLIKLKPPVQRVLRVDWESGKVTFTTKNKVLTALGFLHDNDHVWFKFPITQMLHPLIIL